MERTDAEIVEATLSGSRETFGELITRYQGRIYGLAYGLLRNWDDAQDTAQEAFIRGYVRLNQLRRPERFAGWLKQITVSLCMDRLRSLQSESRLFISLDEANASEELPVALPTASDQDEGLMRELALAQIGKLPRDYRIPLVLFHLNELSYQSLADFLEISIDAARKRVQRARKMLRKEVLKMIDDAFSQHQLSSEFALEIQALFETYELAKEDESNRTEKIDGILAQVMKVDAEGNLVSLAIGPLENRSETATRELRFGPSGVPDEFYDRQGRRLKVRTESVDWHKDPYVIVEASEEIPPGAALEGVHVYRSTFEEAISGHFPLLVKKGLIWNLRSANESPNWLNHTHMILPPSAIVLQCNPTPTAIWQENGCVCVYLKQYTGEWASNGQQLVAFLWPDRDGSCVRDMSLMETEKSPRVREYEETLQAIKGGLDFDDQSTPLKAYLTYTCGILHREEEKLHRVMGKAGNWPDKDDKTWKRWQDWIANAAVLETPEWSSEPEEWTVHPIFVARPGLVTCEDVHLCVYSRGKWYRVGNIGNPYTDWKECADWARSLLKE